MKKLFLVLSVIASVAACQQPDEPMTGPDNPIQGEAGGSMNGKNWTPYSTAIITENDQSRNTFAIGLIKRDEFNIVVEYFGFQDVPQKTGKYMLHKSIIPYDGFTHASFGFVDDDLILKTYYVVEQDTTNFISVDTFNLETGVVSGRFSVTMAHFQAHTSEFPDTLYFRDGWYKTTITYR